MSWIFLIIAGGFEVIWVYFMKQSEGFTRFWPSLATLLAMFASFGLLATAMRTLPLGTSYMVWTGIGALGAFVLEVTLLSGQATPSRIAAATLLLAGLVLMKLSS